MYKLGTDEAFPSSELPHMMYDIAAPAKTVRMKNVADPAKSNKRYLRNRVRAPIKLGLSVGMELKQAIGANIKAAPALPLRSTETPHATPH